MPVQVNAPKDLFAGIIFVAVGLGTFTLSHDYPMGTALQMGPGYFPAAVSLVLAALGLTAIVRGLTRKIADPLTPHRLEPLLLVFASILSFSFLIERAGLIVASAVLIGISCFRRLLSHPLETLVLYVALTGFSALVFVIWFDIRLPLF